MPRLLILIAAVPIIAAFLIRWWLGMRVLASASRRQCACDLELWEKTFGSAHLPPSNQGDAIQFAAKLRKTALAEWKSTEPKAAAAREGTRRFGLAVPPLALLVVLMGVLVGRIPAIWALPVFLLAVALAAIFSFLGIAPELRAMLRTTRRLRDSRVFRRSDDEEAVSACLTALAWKEAAPPVFNLIQK